jgi:hypothetical protein
MYIFLTILKAVIIIVGMVFLNIYFWQGVRGDKVKMKKAIWIFVSILFLLTAITGIEFAIALSK